MVIHRHVSGEGQLVDISMIEMMLAWQAHIFSQYLVGTEEPKREDSLLNGGGYYDFYETADGRYLSVGSLEPKFWVAFCEAIGRPDLNSKGYDLDPLVKQSLKADLRDAIAARPLED